LGWGEDLKISKGVKGFRVLRNDFIGANMVKEGALVGNRCNKRGEMGISPRRLGPFFSRLI